MEIVEEYKNKTDTRLSTIYWNKNKLKHFVTSFAVELLAIKKRSNNYCLLLHYLIVSLNIHLVMFQICWERIGNVSSLQLRYLAHFISSSLPSIKAFRVEERMKRNELSQQWLSEYIKVPHFPENNYIRLGDYIFTRPSQ